jgi:hypothetical protein
MKIRRKRKSAGVGSSKRYDIYSGKRENVTAQNVLGQCPLVILTRVGWREQRCEVKNVKAIGRRLLSVGCIKKRLSCYCSSKLCT